MTNTTVEQIVEVLKQEVTALQETKKRLDARVKQITSEVEQAEQAARATVQVARDKAQAEIAEIEASVLPYKSARSQVEADKQLLHELRQTMESETQRLKYERHVLLAQLDAKIADRQKRLERLITEEAAFKARVLA